MYQKRTHRKKILTALLVALLLVALAGLGYWWFVIHSDDSKKSSTQNDGSSINYDPPTDEEKQAGEDQKDENAKEEDEPPVTDDGKKQVTVIISGAEQYNDTVEVRSFVSGHLEDGTCTINITKDNYRVTKTANAYADASTTICTNPEILRSEFPAAGEWSVTVTYDSAGAHGESSVEKITIK